MLATFDASRDRINAVKELIAFRPKSAVFTFSSPASFEGHGGVGNKWQWRDSGIPAGTAWGSMMRRSSPAGLT